MQHSQPSGVFAKLYIFVVSNEAILWLWVQMTLLALNYGIESYSAW